MQYLSLNTSVIKTRMPPNSLRRHTVYSWNDKQKKSRIFVKMMTNYKSQPTALAPRTAAELPSRVDTRNLALPLKIGNTALSYDSLRGFIKRSPALVRPPKKTKASGEANAAKSAQASPSILPVKSYTRLAKASPLLAAYLPRKR